jgi:hypothetical protein
VGIPEEADEMTGGSKMNAEQLDDLRGLLAGCGGLQWAAEAAAAKMSELRPIIIGGIRLDSEVAGKLPGWAPFQQIEEELSGYSPNAALGAYGNRLAGMRLPWTAGDPEVLRFTKEFVRSATPIARPDQALLEALGSLGKIEQIGNLVTCDGIPIPVGEGQIKQFVAARWPYVGENLLVNASNRKDLAISHDCHEGLLAYSPRIHCENLIQLQKHHPALFWAVWRRDFKAIRRILWKVKRAQLQGWLVSAENLKRRDRQGQRPINEKRIRGVLSDPAMRLMCGTAILSELERLCEILACLNRYKTLTRKGIKRCLKESTSIKEIIESDKPGAIYLAGAVAQIRGSHPSMNKFEARGHGDPMLRTIDHIVKNTTAYGSDKPRLSTPFGKKPALYFIGVEQELIPLVAIIMLVDNLKGLEGSFRHRREKGSTSEVAIENDVVRFAAVIAAHVHTRWARALLNSLSEAENNREWLEAGMPGKLKKTHTQEDKPRKLEAIERPFVGDRNHTRLYGRARERIEQLPKVFEPGWTRGFFFQAWMQSSPEASFLKKCATLQRFSRKGLIAHNVRMIETMADPIPRFSGSAKTTWTGLPTENPVETQHNRMRPFIEQLQGPDKIDLPFRKHFYRERDIIVSEVGMLFAAVTPFTLDPYLHEQITTKIEDDVARFAVEAAWYTTFRSPSRGRQLSKPSKASGTIRSLGRGTTQRGKRLSGR